MHLVQFCNVGNIVGGTAACAWSVTQAIPEAKHTVIFRTPTNLETRNAFSHCNLVTAGRLGTELTKTLRPDLLLLHNISSQYINWGTSFPKEEFPVIQYAHSAGRFHAQADLMVACSGYLAKKLISQEVQILYQGVPTSPSTSRKFRDERKKELTIGRICTPVLKKWPRFLIPFYRFLASQFPRYMWEFVGCPELLQKELSDACHHQVTFYPASWNARKYLHQWDALLYHHRDLSETFGRTASEAMQCGCIPIVDHAGGFIEQIPSGTGFLCSTEKEFVSALGKISYPEERIERSKACKDSARDHFSHRAFRKRLLDLFSRAITNHQQQWNQFAPVAQKIPEATKE